VNTIEYALRDRIGYGAALAVFEAATILVLGALVLMGSEHRGRHFVAEVPG